VRVVEMNSFVMALEKFYKYSALFFIASSVILGIGRVVVRHLPIPGSGVIGEFAIVSFIWAVLMAIAWEVNTQGHLKITVFYDRMPSSIKGILSLGFLFTIISIGFVMIREGIIYIDHTKSVTVTCLGYPRWITFYLPLPISGFGVMIFGIRRAFESFKPTPK
jgi:TRAP-type C4-dicarboxylate transport system permease small subunit